MLLYLLKTTVCLGIFLLFYKLLLEKENMNVFKRFYLIVTIIAALVIPSLVFIEYVEPISTATSYTFTQTPDEMPFAETPVQASDIDAINWSLLAWSIYAIGAVIFGFRFLRNLFQIVNRVRKNLKHKQGYGIKILLLEQLPPHTFFKYIFLNKQEYEANNIPKEVLLHEETHAKQNHSLDVVFIELLQVILWFNPLLYFFKKSIKLNHEFLADSAVLKNSSSTSDYQNTLLSFLSQDSFDKYQSIGMANAINYSSIKKRFTVMKTETSKKAILIRTLLLLPILSVMLYGFSETKLVEKSHSKSERFVIKITNTETGVNLFCAEGCNWTELQLNLKDNKKMAVDKFGISTNNLNNSLNNSDFLIVFRKNKKSIELKGIHGMAWRNLNFSIPINLAQKIDNLGFVFNDSKEASIEEIDLYNILAELFNGHPIEKRFIPLETLHMLESTYRRMTKAQKENSEPFPKYLAEVQESKVSQEKINTFMNLASKVNDIKQLKEMFNLLSPREQYEVIDPYAYSMIALMLSKEKNLNKSKKEK